MLVARRPVSIGEFVLAPGDVVTRAMTDLLPTNRLQQMVDHGFVDETGDEASNNMAIELLLDRVSVLEEQVAILRGQIASQGAKIKMKVPQAVEAPEGGGSDG